MLYFYHFKKDRVMKNQLIVSIEFVRALSIILPALKESANQFGVIPYGQHIDSGVLGAISGMRILTYLKFDKRMSERQVCNAILKENWKMIEVVR